MRRSCTLAAGLVLGLALSFPSFAQAPAPAEEPSALRQALSHHEIGDLVDQLAADDLEKRDRIVERIRAQGARAIPVLEATVTRHPDPEVRWNAKWLLGEMRRELSADELERRAPELGGQNRDAPQGGEARRLPSRPRLDLQDDLAAQIRRLLEELQEDGPFGRLPETPRPHLRFGSGWGSGQGGDPFDELDLDLDERIRRTIEEAQRMHEEALRDHQRAMDRHEDLLRRLRERRGPGMPGQPGSSARASSMSFSIGADGRVRVEVTEQGADGSTTQKAYEAESMDELRRQHPELLEHQTFLFDFGLGEGRPGGGLRLPGWSQRDEPPRPAPPVEPTPPASQDRADQDRLGVWITVLDETIRAQRAIEAEFGLVVDRVDRGSLAERLEVRPRDVLVRINGEELREAGTIRRVLSGLEPTDEVVLEVWRAGAGTLELKAPKASEERWY